MHKPRSANTVEMVVPTNEQMVEQTNAQTHANVFKRKFWKNTV